LIDEDRAEFCDVFELVRDEVNPRTLKEWILAADTAYAEWEIFRLRGLKVRVVLAALAEAFHKEVNIGIQIVGFRGKRPDWHVKFRKWVVGMLAGDASAKLSVTKTLETAGLTLESLVASTFAFTISTQVATDKMVDAAYQRRKAFYADLERLRSKGAPNDLPAKVVESPSVAPSDGATGGQGKARDDVNGDGAVGHPSSVDEGH
jgi:hypothetical protein